MSSRKESKDLRAEKSTKQMAQNRRNILRLGALGAVACLPPMSCRDRRTRRHGAGRNALGRQAGRAKGADTPRWKVGTSSMAKSQRELSAKKSADFARVTLSSQ